MKYCQTYQEELEETKKRYPKFKIVKKENSFFMKAISYFLHGITFGGLSSNKFQTAFITTIGYTMYVPEMWDDMLELNKHLILFHERTHVEQKEREGSFLFSLKYLFWPLPIFKADARLKYEIEAYARQLALGNILYNFKVDSSSDSFKHVVDNLVTSNYFWTSTSRKKVSDLLEKQIKNLLNKG